MNIKESEKKQLSRNPENLYKYILNRENAVIFNFFIPSPKSIMIFEIFIQDFKIQDLQVENTMMKQLLGGTNRIIFLR